MNSSYTVNKDNYQNGIPPDVVNVILSDDLDQSLYKNLFKDSPFWIYEHSKRKHVTLPESITEIEAEAFHSCDLIESITIPENVTRIGKEAFYHCGHLLVVNLIQVVLPQKLQVIDERAFCGCKILGEIKLPLSLNKLGEGAFEGCLQCRGSIVIPQGVTEIQPYTFADCTGIVSIQIPNSLSVIGDKAFKDCWDLQYILIPKTCQIAENAFEIDDTLMGDEWLKHKWTTMGRIIKGNGDGLEWLKNRFDDLPLHKLCSQSNLTIDQIREISNDDLSLHTFDEMHITPLHVLSCNPSATLEMIRELASKYCPLALVMKDAKDNTAQDLYFDSKNMTNPISDEMTINYLKSRCADNSDSFIHDMITSGLAYDKIDIFMAFQGKPISPCLSKSHPVTGLLPFMTAVVSHQQRLDCVYDIAMADSIIQLSSKSIMKLIQKE